MRLLTTAILLLFFAGCVMGPSAPPPRNDKAIEIINQLAANTTGKTSPPASLPEMEITVPPMVVPPVPQRTMTREEALRAAQATQDRLNAQRQSIMTEEEYAKRRAYNAELQRQQELARELTELQRQIDELEALMPKLIAQEIAKAQEAQAQAAYLRQREAKVRREMDALWRSLLK